MNQNFSGLRRLSTRYFSEYGTTGAGRKIMQVVFGFDVPVLETVFGFEECSVVQDTRSIFIGSWRARNKISC